MKKPDIFGTPVFDCINGIICLGDEINGLVLWNPATREHKVVPKPFCDLFDSVNFAFGYDHNSNDYKVVRVVTFEGHHGELILPSVVHVHVYNLSTDSWRQIDPTFDPSITYFPGDCDELYLNGVHHWPSCRSIDEHGQHCKVIVCFDMIDEVFRTIRMPDLGDISHINKIGKTSAVLSNCVALIVYDMNETVIEKTFDIWVMREYGVEESWTKQFIIKPGLIFQRTNHFVGAGELLFVGDKLLLVNGNKGQILLYDFGTQEIKNLQLRNCSDSFCVSRLMIYVESLVSVKGGNVFESLMCP